MSARFLNEFTSLILDTKDRNELVDFFKGILTPKELEEIPVRLQIIKMLKAGVPQHEIARKLGVGIATVTRGSKEVQKGKFKNV